MKLRNVLTIYACLSCAATLAQSPIGESHTTVRGFYRQCRDRRPIRLAPKPEGKHLQTVFPCVQRHGHDLYHPEQIQLGLHVAKHEQLRNLYVTQPGVGTKTVVLPQTGHQNRTLSGLALDFSGIHFRGFFFR